VQIAVYIIRFNTKQLIKITKIQKIASVDYNILKIECFYIREQREVKRTKPCLEHTDKGHQKSEPFLVRFLNIIDSVSVICSILIISVAICSGRAFEQHLA
jgi:hypothetical protein